jgi:dihydropyrimidinase
MATCVKTYGINTFKHFMSYKGALMVNDDQLYDALRRCAGFSPMPLVHAENGDVVFGMQQHYLEAGIAGPEGHAHSLPPAVESGATTRAIMVADMAGCRFTSCIRRAGRHTRRSLRARAAGQRVFGQPLIQHLVLDEDEYHNDDWDYAARRKMSPPFRTKDHQASLWAGLQSGSLHVVATDHCAFTTAQKRLGRTDFIKIPNETGGLEDRLPVLRRAGVNTGRLTPEEFGPVTSTNTARILNIFPRKRAVASGSDADLVIWDPDATKTRKRTAPHGVQRHDVTP